MTMRDEQAIRTLAFSAAHFGHSKPGIFGCDLPDSDLLDGTVFIRCAGIVMDTLGWVREGQVSEMDILDRPLRGLTLIDY
jgi:hypothetical protein